MTDKSLHERWTTVIDEVQVSRALTRICYEIVEKDGKASRLAVVGIRTGGEFLGRRIQSGLKELTKEEIPFGVLDITLYRDDLSHTAEQPTLKGTELPFSISGKRIILVDDVLFTGRTVRAALDAIIDFGRPSRVELAVLADRGHRELPIRPDYVGKNLPTNVDEFVKVTLQELGETDGVHIASKLPESGRSKEGK
ncbi:MAG: bifunctional pyr operon transcriptional regulator/uracil phosphoribosyltransferase PyrR [Bdellovibrionales bacterium]|nr:bifunctional pyr operon transcriptional regulator/uracil phosphoribosyltransferase PyrR [Bdellovibrionales bacterium]